MTKGLTSMRLKGKGEGAAELERTGSCGKQLQNKTETHSLTQQIKDITKQNFDLERRRTC